MEVLSHELVVTEEAKFDYADLFGMLVGDFGNDLPPYFNINPNIKEEVETYIKTRKSLWHKHYLRLTYLVEESDIDLMLFIKQGKVLENIQHWELVGICDKEAWNEDLEESGQIRAWYETKVACLPKEKDWVEELYRNKMLEYLDLIYDVGGRDGYIRSCEELIVQLSSEFKYDKIDRLTTRGVKHFIRSKSWDTETANAIIGILDELLEREREEADKSYF